MKIVAVIMMVAGTGVGAGGAMEFVFFGPGAVQFWAGIIAMPAGFASTVAGILLWRRGLKTRTVVRNASVALLAATVVTTAMRVMGPPAMLLGLIGSLTPLVWIGRTAATRRGPERAR